MERGLTDIKGEKQESPLSQEMAKTRSKPVQNLFRSTSILSRARRLACFRSAIDDGASLSQLFLSSQEKKERIKSRLLFH